MQYYHEEMMKQLIEDRHESILAVMAASQRRSVMLSRFGLMLIRIGETLRQDAPAARRAMELDRPTRSRPGLTS